MVVSALVAVVPELIDNQDASGNTALAIACVEGYPELVDLVRGVVPCRCGVIDVLTTCMHVLSAARVAYWRRRRHCQSQLEGKHCTPPGCAQRHSGTCCCQRALFQTRSECECAHTQAAVKSLLEAGCPLASFDLEGRSPLNEVGYVVLPCVVKH